MLFNIIPSHGSHSSFCEVLQKLEKIQTVHPVAVTLESPGCHDRRPCSKVSTSGGAISSTVGHNGFWSS